MVSGDVIRILRRFQEKKVIVKLLGLLITITIT